MACAKCEGCVDEKRPSRLSHVHAKQPPRRVHQTTKQQRTAPAAYAEHTLGLLMLSVKGAWAHQGGPLTAPPQLTTPAVTSVSINVSRRAARAERAPASMCTQNRAARPSLPGSAGAGSRQLASAHALADANAQLCNSQGAASLPGPARAACHRAREPQPQCRLHYLGHGQPSPNG